MMTSNRISRTTLLALTFGILAWFLPGSPAGAQATDPEAPQNGAQSGAPNAAQNETEAGQAPEASPRVQEGISVKLAVESLSGEAPALQEGSHVRVRFTITDTASGAPLSGLYPAAWLDRMPTEKAATGSCSEKVSTFLGGSLFAQPELNLNVYYVLALNDDATITVVDPLFGFGSTKLLALVNLPGNGEAWHVDAPRRRIYVAIPETGQVAVVNTDTWKVLTNVPTGGRPSRLAMQGDGRHLWVADGGDGAGGVQILDLDNLTLAGKVEAGLGQRELVLSSDDRYAFVSARASGTVTIIATDTLQALATVPTAAEPVSMDYSSQGQAAYVSHLDGTIVAVDGERQRVVNRLQVDPGLGQLRFAPGGRHGFVVNPKTSWLYIVDAASGRVVQSGGMEEEPDQVTFTEELAYIRHQGTDIVLMIPLGDIGREGQPLAVVDFPGGHSAPKEGVAPAAAPSIVQAPGALAVLVANPADKMIYFYKEGMAAPMGNFQNYGRQPRAVEVFDRSLRERAPGEYETTVQLRRAGSYDMAFFLDSPKMVQCFPMTVAEDPAAARLPTATAQVRPLVTETQIPVGKLLSLRFEVTDPATGEPLENLRDLQVLAFRGPGQWQQRTVAKAVGAGIYETDLTPLEEGLYYIIVHSRSLGLDVARGSYLTLEAVEAPVAKAADSRQGAAGGSRPETLFAD
jgi:hypothetical protein